MGSPTGTNDFKYLGNTYLEVSGVSMLVMSIKHKNAKSIMKLDLETCYRFSKYRGSKTSQKWSSFVFSYLCYLSKRIWRTKIKWSFNIIRLNFWPIGHEAQPTSEVLDCFIFLYFQENYPKKQNHFKIK